MRLDISEVLREVGKQLSYDIQEPPLVDEDVEGIRPITGRITFQNAGGTLIINGKAETAVTLPCSRCNRYFEQPMAFPIEEQFELQHVSAGSRTLQTVAVVEEDESPIAEPLFEGQLFHLTELLRQSILLEEPTRPLPPETADGRCAHCHLRPEEVLQPVQETIEEEVVIHPAFAKLSQLLEKRE